MKVNFFWKPKLEPKPVLISHELSIFALTKNTCLLNFFLFCAIISYGKCLWENSFWKNFICKKTHITTWYAMNPCFHSASRFAIFLWQCSILITSMLKPFWNRLSLLFLIHLYFTSYQNRLLFMFLIPTHLCSLAPTNLPSLLKPLFLRSPHSIKRSALLSINSSIYDHFLDCGKVITGFCISILQTTTSDSLIAPLFWLVRLKTIDNSESQLNTEGNGDWQKPLQKFVQNIHFFGNFQMKQVCANLIKYNHKSKSFVWMFSQYFYFWEKFSIKCFFQFCSHFHNEIENWIELPSW